MILGWGALSCQGNRHVETPHLDRLAREGMRFTQAYVTPQCTPTRATLLTGQYTARNGMFHVIPPYCYPYARMKEIPHKENIGREAFLLPKGLQAAGYRTAAIGKWHLTANADGHYNGLNAGASQHYGFDVVAQPQRHAREFVTGDKAVDRFTDEGLEFIKQNRQNPFFLYLSHHSIHNVVAAPDEVVAKYRARGYPEKDFQNATYLAAIEHLDRAFGRLMEGLEKQGVADNTVLMFLTDNGGIHRQLKPPAQGSERLEIRERLFDNAPFREGKGFAYEGGIRVPFLVRWPGVTQAGRVSREPVHAVDLLPTMLEAAGAKAPAGYPLDGVSLREAMRGRKLAKRPLYWYMPFYDLNWGATPSAAMREGDWKLIEYFGDWFDASAGYRYVTEPKLELYHLGKDAGEKVDLARKEAARAARMQRQLREWIAQCGARVPGVNPAYDPSRAFETVRGQPS